MNLFHKAGKTLKSSIISAKIVRRVLLSGVACFLIVLLVAGFFLFPILKEQAIGRGRISTEHLSDLFSKAQSDMEQSADFIAGNLDFNQFLGEYLQNPNELNQNRLSLKLESLSYANPQIYFIALKTEDFPVITSAFHKWRAYEGLYENPAYIRLLEATHGVYFSPIYQTEEPAISSGKIDSYNACSVSKNYYISNKKFTVSIFYGVDSFLREARSIYSPFLDGYRITSNSGKLIYEQQPGEFASLSGLEHSLNTKGEVKTHDGYFFAENTNNFTWQIETFASDNTINGSFLSIFFIIILFFLLSVLITIFFITPYVLRRMRPLKDLSDTMAAYSIGRRDVYSTIKTDDEINEMSRIFNRMVESNNAYIRELLESEEMRQQMKYSLLISQIDPHFIYNTMNIITALARQKKHEDVIAVNQALEKILQDRLRVHDIEIYDTVEHEIRIVKQYALIMAYRYGNLVDMEYRIEDVLETEEIPKNLIQPLVENAYYHGLTTEEGVVEGRIIISVFTAGDDIVIQVSDNGAGIPEDKLKKLKNREFSEDSERGRHIGLGNVVDRIEYLYHRKDCIEYISAEGRGCTVRLFLSRRRKRTGT